MAEQREKCGSVLLKFQGKTVKLEIFESLQWPSFEADAGLYRVRVGDIYSGKWLEPQQGEGCTMFFTPGGLAQLLAREITKPGALEELRNSRPFLRKGQYVRYHPADFERAISRTIAGSDPVHCIDGQWRIQLSGVGFVPCDEVMGLDRFGREMPKPEARP